MSIKLGGGDVATPILSTASIVRMAGPFALGVPGFVDAEPDHILGLSLPIERLKNEMNERMNE